MQQDIETVDPALVQTVFNMIKNSECKWRILRAIAKEFSHEDILKPERRRTVFRLALHRCS